MLLILPIAMGATSLPKPSRRASVSMSLEREEEMNIGYCFSKYNLFVILDRGGNELHII